MGEYISPRVKGLIVVLIVICTIAIWGYFLSSFLAQPIDDSPVDGGSGVQSDGLSLTGSLAYNQSGLQLSNRQTLTLYIPESRYTPAWSRIIGQMKAQDIDLTIVTYRDRFFQDKLIDQHIMSDQIDVIMIDSDHVSAMSGRGQTLVQDDAMLGFVHHSVTSLMQRYPYFFVRGIDPMVWLSKTPTSDPLTIEYIRNLQSVQDTQSQFYIPVLIGYNSGDQQMIADQTHPLIDTGIIDRLRYHNATTPSYTTAVQTILSHDHKYRSTGYILKLQEYLLKKMPECTHLLGLCMLYKNMTSVVPAFWSDSRYYRYMTQEEPIMLPFAYRTTTYPCKARGFVINRLSPHKTQAITLLQTLISSLNRFDFDLYDNNLSAYQQLLDIQLQSKRSVSWSDMVSMCRF